MLEKLPSGIGHALRGVRAGFDKIVSERHPFVDVSETMLLTSPAFEDMTSIPPRYTADGERLSPPLAWRGAPAGARGMVLIVEDSDAPTPEPLVHLLAWDLPPDLREIPEGEFRSPGHDGLDEVLGRNAYMQTAWLPPDPPAGHGPHLYVFQLFALDRQLSFDRRPGRAEVVKAMQGHVLAKGVLAGSYERT